MWAVEAWQNGHFVIVQGGIDDREDAEREARRLAPNYGGLRLMLVAQYDVDGVLLTIVVPE